MIAERDRPDREEQAYVSVAERLHLLSLPARLRIVDMLRCREECVCALQEALDRPQSYVSQQLRVLRKAGIIERHRGGTEGAGMSGTSTTGWPIRGLGAWWRQPWDRQGP
jgi:DNA-binding transcriptional ArsR family regulator